MLYADPGSGVLLWQILAGGVVGAMFYVRKLIAFFRGRGSSSTQQESPLKPKSSQ